jgi:hypothetical protein
VVAKRLARSRHVGLGLELRPAIAAAAGAPGGGHGPEPPDDLLLERTIGGPRGLYELGMEIVLEAQVEALHGVYSRGLM